VGLAALAAALAMPQVAAAGPLAWRGIVEGPYGRPWDHAERMDTLRWMAGHEMNAYVHAPKDDLYQRSQWRDPYPADQQAEFDREIALARRRGIEWVPNLSPALPLLPTPALPEGQPSRDLCFSCPADLDVVVAKLRPFLDAGARAVMISFDDVTKAMSHPEDLAAYGAGDEAFGRANGEFLTKLDARLREADPASRLLMAPADYSGVADTPYLRGLRSTLAPGIDVIWTGTNVPSEHWTPADARAYGEWIGRTPVVWENWTNNDTAGNVTAEPGTARLFLGPYLRQPASAAAVRGFLFNPANESYLNQLPLATAADWMSDPPSYHPGRSWRAALRELAPGRTPAARDLRSTLRAWAETNWSNKLDREREAPTFTRHSGRLLDRYAGGGWRPRMAKLLRELRLVEQAPRRLPDLPEPGIAEQGAEFLDAARKNARAGDAAARLLAAERPALEARRVRSGYAGTAVAPDPGEAAGLRAELDSARTTARAETEFTYGWRTPLAFEIPPYPVPRNVMDVFLDRVQALDDSWPGDEAAAGVELALAGEPVHLGAGGEFELPPSACGERLVATDGAGGRTALTLRGCG
jgi:hyaluronoglucosaminidase